MWVVVASRVHDERCCIGDHSSLSSLFAGALEGFGSVLSALLSAWEEIKAAEELRAQQEAELFKNKTQTSTFQTEEVLPLNVLRSA